MRRISVLLLIAIASTPCAVRGQTVGDFGAFQAKIASKYGETKLKTVNKGGVLRLELTLSDKRFRGSSVGAADSAKVIATFAVANLPAGYRPDSIMVRIVTTEWTVGAVKGTEVDSKTFAVAKLH